MDISCKIKEIRKLNNLTQDQFAEKIGVARATVINWEKGNTQPTHNEYNGIVKIFDNINSSPQTNTIPLFDAVAVGGMTGLNADVTAQTNAIADIDVGTLFSQATAALRVAGESMLPKYPPMCIVALREVFDKHDLDYGQDYVIETQENRVIKRIMKSAKGDDFIEMTSYNDSIDIRGVLIYAPRDLPLKNIKRVYKVLGRVVYEVEGGIFYKNNNTGNQ